MKRKTLKVDRWRVSWATLGMGTVREGESIIFQDKKAGQYGPIVLKII